jgi:serine/threonine-protein kinase
MFAAIIPNPPLKTLVASLIAASMNPLAMWLAVALGLVNAEINASPLLMHHPDFILVGVAVVISHVWTRTGQQVVRARELGSYHVGELLGQGGMGVVYRATHRMLARSAAIKFIRPEILAGGDPAMIDLAITRFKREAEIAASLQSPHTVVLYDFGVADDRSLYYVMELLEGLSVEQLVQQAGALTPGRTIFILRQVCESLEEAHDRGLVHRDITPGNIHVGRMGVRYDFAKVLDFGLAKSFRSQGPPTRIETDAGGVPGTPDYTAPEIIQGKPFDGRADLYALGCVAYFMLTGRQVFEAANVFHAMSRHLNDEPAPPSRVARQIIPAALDQLVLACLAKDPADRPPGAAELSGALALVPAERWDDEQAREWWSSRGVMSSASPREDPSGPPAAPESTPSPPTPPPAGRPPRRT